MSPIALPAAASTNPILEPQWSRASDKRPSPFDPKVREYKEGPEGASSASDQKSSAQRIIRLEAFWKVQTWL